MAMRQKQKNQPKIMYLYVEQRHNDRVSCICLPISIFGFPVPENVSLFV